MDIVKKGEIHLYCLSLRCNRKWEIKLQSEANCFLRQYLLKKGVPFFPKVVPEFPILDFPTTLGLSNNGQTNESTLLWKIQQEKLDRSSNSFLLYQWPTKCLCTYILYRLQHLMPDSTGVQICLWNFAIALTYIILFPSATLKF